MECPQPALFWVPRVTDRASISGASMQTTCNGAILFHQQYGILVLLSFQKELLPTFGLELPRPCNYLRPEGEFVWEPSNARPHELTYNSVRVHSHRAFQLQAYKQQILSNEQQQTNIPQLDAMGLIVFLANFARYPCQICNVKRVQSADSRTSCWKQKNTWRIFVHASIYSQMSSTNQAWSDNHEIFGLARNHLIVSAIRTAIFAFQGGPNIVVENKTSCRATLEVESTTATSMTGTQA